MDNIDKNQESPKLSEKESIIPELRFDEFKDSWKITKITDIAKLVSGRTPKTSKKEYWNGDINWFTAPELVGKKYLTESEKKITEEGLKSSSIQLIPPKSILLSTRVKIGDRSINLEKSSTNQGIQSLILNEGYSEEFIYYSIDQIKNELNSKACGVRSKEISKKDLLDIKMNIPSLEEQKKIAEFLSVIDDTIELYEERLDHLIKISEYTIKDFYDNLSGYDQKELDEVINIVSSKLSQKDIKDKSGEYKVYGNQGVIKCIDSYQSDEQYISLIREGVNVGKVELKDSFTSILRPMQYITPKKGNDLFFIYFYLKSINFEKFVVGDSIGRIYNKDFLKEKVYIPPLELQQQIGNTFLLIEETNYQMEKEIDFLKKYKKSLIKQLMA